MKRILLNVVITIIAIMILIANITVTFAAEDDGITKLTANKTAAQNGETFTVTISQESQNGIVAFESNLEYDKTLFTLTNKSIGNGWGDLSNDDKIDTFSSSGDPINSGDICVLTFLVNDSATANDSTISLKNIVYYLDDTNHESQNNVSVNVSVGATSTTNNTTDNNTTTNNTTDGNTTTNNTTDNGNTTTNNTTNSGSTTTNNTTNSGSTTTNNTTTNNTTTNNTTTNATSIPKAGNTTNKLLITALAVIGFAIVFYIQYRKFNEI